MQKISTYKMETYRKSRISIHFLLCFGICILWVGRTAAQSTFTVHGYLTQAFAIADHHQIYGIPVTGTSDYRNLALQFRYDINAANTAVIQFNHRRMGLSQLMTVNKDVELGWAFFEHRFSNGTSVKIGKVLIPLGIYNEIRDVNILLPFYRAPYIPYASDSYIGETINGFCISHTLTFPGNWSMDISAYGGEWQFYEFHFIRNPLSGQPVHIIQEGKMKKAFGSQIWLNTPLNGLRIGGAGTIGKLTGGINFSEDGTLGPQHVQAFIFSGDGDFSRLLLRGEFSLTSLPKYNFSTYAYNILAGVHLRDNFTINMQHEFVHLVNFPVPEILQAQVGRSSKDIDYVKDTALGLSYAFRSYLILKIEMHWHDSLIIGDIPVNMFADAPYFTRYAIFSVAASF